jgi:hypothetical protein
VVARCDLEVWLLLRTRGFLELADEFFEGNALKIGDVPRDGESGAVLPARSFESDGWVMSSAFARSAWVFFFL